jgi:hypothetical protein
VLGGCIKIWIALEVNLDPLGIQIKCLYFVLLLLNMFKDLDAEVEYIPVGWNLPCGQVFDLEHLVTFSRN